MIDLGDVCGKKSRRNGIGASFDGRSITFFFLGKSRGNRYLDDYSFRRVRNESFSYVKRV